MMKKRILIIENDQEIREILAIILEEEGYEVRTLSTDKTVLNHIVTFEPHTILLDVIKPTQEGTELCRALKETDHTKDIPVIVLSTHMQAHSLKKVCADEVVQKPFDISQLLSVIEGELTA